MIRDKYGKIPTDFWVFNMPAALPTDGKMLLDLAYFVTEIVFVSAVEACSVRACRTGWLRIRGAPQPKQETLGTGHGADHHLACIGGIPLYVSTAMVKPAEVREVLMLSKFHLAAEVRITHSTHSYFIYQLLLLLAVAFPLGGGN